MIAQASGIYTLYLSLFWLPSYLQDTKHLTIMKTGLYTAVPWAIAVPVSIVIGLASDRMLRNDTLLAGGRRAIVIACILLAAVIVFVPFTDDTTLILTLFALSLSGINAMISLNLSLVTDLVHRAQDVGKAISLAILSGNLCGLLAPIVTGYVVAGLGSVRLGAVDRRHSPDYRRHRARHHDAQRHSTGVGNRGGAAARP